MKRIGRIISAALLTLAISLGLAGVAPPVASAYNPFGGDICNGSVANSSPVCKTNGSNPISASSGLFVKIILILSIVAGVAAVLVIIIAGIMFVTSGGDSGRVQTARRMITGAIIGIIIIVVAQALIAFVINIVK